VRLVEERQRYVVDSVLVDRAEMVAAGRTAAAPRPPAAELVVVVRRAAARAGAGAALQTARHSRRRPPPAPLSGRQTTDEISSYIGASTLPHVSISQMLM